MKVSSPFHLNLKESSEKARDFHQQVELMDVSDQALVEYVERFLFAYRTTLERYFPAFLDTISFYKDYPYHTHVIRIGRNGVIIGHRPNQSSEVIVIKAEDLDPPLTTATIFEIQKQLCLPVMYFDFSIRSYNQQEAEQCGIAQGLKDALGYFWQVLDVADFSRLCQQLLAAEGINCEEASGSETSLHFDTVGELLLHEPAGFRRFEKWGFEFKHYKHERVSSEMIRQVEHSLTESDAEVDVACILTSGDLTSVGKHIAIENQRIRVWDREILNRLVNQHLDILEPYFLEYATAVGDVLALPADMPFPGRYQEFEQRLVNCKPGREHFSKYEGIGIDIWKYLFCPPLGEPRPQSQTRDKRQRRDVLFPNRLGSSFWERVSNRFQADFIIVDFKNYTDLIDGDVIDDVVKYSNDAIGYFIVVNSRHGASSSAEDAQLRYVSVKKPMTAVLVLSDAQLLEMVRRKEHGEAAEDVLQDLLDELLIKV